MEFKISTEPLNLMFTDLDVAELFTTKGNSAVYQVVKLLGPTGEEDEKAMYGYVNLKTGLIKLMDENFVDFPVLEVELVEPIKVRALI